MQNRIIEIAAIRVDGSGTPLDEYATLVNPNRDLGPTDIHGITARYH
jgi:DNA polymerase-3 subunit epsilon